MAIDRHSELLALLLANGQTPIQDIVDKLGASLATVRRDLIDLEKAGRVERLRGAARIANGSRNEVAFASREQHNLPAKRLIANRAAQFIEPSATVFLDSSTTVLQLARHIATSEIQTRVFTNSLSVALELAPFSHIEMTLIGGRIRSENMSSVGPLALKALDELWVDQLFLGATAIDDGARISSLDPDEAAVNARMISRAGHAYILADQSKLEAHSTHAVAQLNKNQTIISDGAPNQTLANFVLQNGLNFIDASMP